MEIMKIFKKTIATNITAHLFCILLTVVCSRHNIWKKHILNMEKNFKNYSTVLIGNPNELKKKRSRLLDICIGTNSSNFIKSVQTNLALFL